MTAALRPGSTEELIHMLRSRPGRLRLIGSGSRQHRLGDAVDATPLELGGLDRIERLDAGDQTCSVGSGVRREVLDQALDEHGLCLPCSGGGTIGGLFASDPIGATTAGGPSPRSLLLGLEAVLADGTEFRSGARVVKSVAGFDVHKLFVGSQGRLFVATSLHLRLRPKPRTSVWFCRSSLEAPAALVLFQCLRTLAVPPSALHLVRAGTEWSVRGCFSGRASFVAAALASHELPEGPPFTDVHLRAAAGGEVLTGIVPPSHLPRLLAAAPANAAFVLHGGGRFELSLATPVATDTLLAHLPSIGAHACIAAGAPARRGLSTPLDPGQQQLTDSLTKALDPHGILA